MTQQHGILLLDKPKGLSSAQCVARIKRLGQKKIGHAGTLDPMATGLLVVLLGQATKLSGYLLEGGAKTYCGALCLGQESDTWDAEGQVLQTLPVKAEAADIEREISAWLQVREQVVPPYSAAKHQGQPLYKLARAGKETPVKIKTLQISHAELLEIQWVDFPVVRFRVTCSSGSYIRSLAHSLGKRLGCGAMLTELTREYSHPYHLDHAHSLDKVLEEKEGLEQKVLPLNSALPGWPVFCLDASQEALVRNGQAVNHQEQWGSFAPLDRALLCDAHQGSLALAHYVSDPSPQWVILRGLW